MFRILEKMRGGSGLGDNMDEDYGFVIGVILVLVVFVWIL